MAVPLWAAGVTPLAGWGKLGPVNEDRHYPQSRSVAPVRRVWPFLSLALLAAWLAGCVAQPVRTSDDDAEPPQVSGLGNDDNGEPVLLRASANEVLIRAIGLVGTPYRYGGNTPEGGFDCSGLVAYVFREATGLQLPRSTREQIAYPARSIGRDDLRPGDLVFFNPRGGRVSHIGIYVGEGRFVHAPSSGGTVRLDELDSDYWRRAFVSGKRLLAQ